MDDKKLKNLQLIGFVFIISVLAYIPIMFFVDKFLHFSKAFLDKQTEIERYSFYVSAFLILLIIALKRFIYFPAKIVYKTESEAFDLWYKMDVILMSIGESIGTIGFLVFFFGASYFRAVLLVIISVLVIATLFPFKMRYQMRFDQLKEMKREKGIYDET